MAVAVTQGRQWSDGKALHAAGTLTFSGSYTTGGDAVDFSFLRTSRSPYYVTIVGIAGYVYEYDAENGTVLVRAQTAAPAEDDALGELTAGAYPAGVTGDTVSYYIVAPQFI